jgi:hypothetical protein
MVTTEPVIVGWILIKLIVYDVTKVFIEDFVMIGAIIVKKLTFY